MRIGALALAATILYVFRCQYTDGFGNHFREIR